jgi:hypothetical protein
MGTPTPGKQMWENKNGQCNRQLMGIYLYYQVYDKPLQVFSTSPMTGAFRDGYCRTGKDDPGNHSVAGMAKVEHHIRTPVLVG